MIQNDNSTTSRFYLLSLDTVSNETDNLISTVGYQVVSPGQDYPVKVIPRRYSFDMEQGRKLAEYQLVYITSGTGTFTDHEGSRVIIPGTMILIRPGYWHSYQPNRDTGWTEYYIGFNGPVFRDTIGDFFGEKKGPIELGLSAPIVDLFEQALYYAERQCEQTMPLLLSLVLHQLSLMNYNLASRNRNDDKIAEAVGTVKQYMANHLSEQIDIQALAGQLGMSYTWLRRMFRKHTGMPPAQYLQQLRLNSSKYFLRNTTLPVKNIAFECGFSTSEYFCNVFQEMNGITPGAYRASYKEAD